MRPISKLAGTWIAVAIVLVLSLSACTGRNNPITPGPSVTPSSSVEESTPITGPATLPPRTTAPEETVKPTKTDEPETAKPETSNAPTSDGAAPPATQFAQRWGQKYPNVPEYAILKAANVTCRAIESGGDTWADNAVALAAIKTAVDAAGMSGNDALEFAQDAKQNYCASVSNPT